MMVQSFSVRGLAPLFCLLTIFSLSDSAFAEVDGKAGQKTTVREVINQKELELEVDSEFSTTGPTKMVCTRKFCDFQEFKYELNVDLGIRWNGKKNFTLTNTFGEILYGHSAKSDILTYEFFDYQGNWVSTLQSPLGGKGPWEILSASSQWTNTLIVFAGLKIAESKPNWKMRAIALGSAVTVAVAASALTTKAYLSYKSKVPAPAPNIIPDPTPAVTGSDEDPKEVPSRGALYDLRSGLSDKAIAYYRLDPPEVNTLNTHVYLQKMYIEGLPGNEIPIKELQEILLIEIAPTPAIVRVLRNSEHLKALMKLQKWAEGEIARLHIRGYDPSEEESIRETLTEKRISYLESAIAAEEHKQFVRSFLKGKPKLIALYSNGLGENVFELRAFQEEMRNQPEIFSEDFVDFLNSPAERTVIARYPTNNEKMTYIRDKVSSLQLAKWKQDFFAISHDAEDIYNGGFPGNIIPLDEFQQLIRDHSSKISARTLRTVFDFRNLNMLARTFTSRSDVEENLVKQIENEYKR